MVVVAGASIGGLVLSNSASSAAQRTDTIVVQLVSIRAHVLDAAVSGTAFLVSHAAKDATALTSAGQEVDVELAALKSADLNPSEKAALAVVLRAWHVTDSSRRAVLSSGADSAVPVEVLLRPVFEEEMNTSLNEVTAQLTALDDLMSADVAARRNARDTTQTASTVAIAVAITIGFVAGLWLLRQLKEQQETVRRRERRLSALVEHASDGILMVDGGGQVTFVTPSFSQEFFETNAATTFQGMIHPEDRDHAAKAWQRVTSGGGGTVSEIEARLLRLDGAWRYAWVKLTNRLGDPAVDGIVLNVTDVSDRHEFEKTLTHQALHDALTGLPNRELLRHRMERAGATAGQEEHSVLYLD
jgi:PAS domain S-box-containing protein